jgi:hypothetical protein
MAYLSDEGATTLTLILLDAHSAARDFAKPSTAPFALEIEE